jgi:hypothetical protein
MAMLRGELDWVVMKCLEKSRERRYETANGLARDIQRYLADEPVEARPPSAGYRLGKFFKRHKAPVIASGLVLLALLVGIAGTTYGLFRAEAQRKAAETARKAEAEQRAQALVERDKAIAAERQTGIERDKAIAAEAKTKTIIECLTQDLLTQAEPANNAAEDHVTLLEVVDRAAAKVGQRFADQPELESALRATIAQTYHGLASWAKAEAQLRSLLDAARKRDPQSAESYLALSRLAHILRHRGRRDAEVMKMAETAAEGLERTLGPDHPDTLTALNNLASAYQAAGKLAEAIALLERVRDARIAKFGPDLPDTLTAVNNLASAYQAAGMLPEAIVLYERVRDATIAQLGSDHPHTLTTLNNLASACQAVGKLAEAIALLERVRDASTAQLGPDHPDTLTTLNNLAGAYRAAGRLPEAIALFERVRDARTARLGPDHPDTLTTLNGLAVAYLAAGKLAEAIALLERVRDARIARLGPDHPHTLITLANLAAAYEDAGKFPEAIALHERVRDATIAQLGPDHPHTLTELNNLAAAYWKAKQLDKSVPLFEDVLKWQEAKLGRQHPDTLLTVANLGVNYRDSGRLDEAIPLLEEAYRAGGKLPDLRWVGAQLLDAYAKAGRSTEAAKLVPEFLAETRKALPKDSAQLAGALAQTGLTLLQVQAYADAEPLLREGLAIREKTQPDVWNTFTAKSMLGGALMGQKKYADAEPLLVAGYDGMKRREATIPPQARDRLTEALERLVQLYEATAKPDQAARWSKELEARKAAGKPPERKP